jgi:DNA-binding NarL/FixJ family response regulator
MTIRVLIADDQPAVRDGLAMLLGLIDDVEIVATAADGIQAVERARSELPDIVLMDLRMPRLEGAEATRQILAAVPDTRVLVLTTYADDEFLFPALQAGARGYLTKDRHRGRNRTRDQSAQRRPDPARPRRAAATRDRRPRSNPASASHRPGTSVAARPSRRTHATRNRRAQADRRRAVEQRHRRPAGPQPRRRQDPHQLRSSTRPAPATAPKPSATHTSTAWHSSRWSSSSASPTAVPLSRPSRHSRNARPPCCYRADPATHEPSPDRPAFRAALTNTDRRRAPSSARKPSMRPTRC